MATMFSKVGVFGSRFNAEYTEKLCVVRAEAFLSTLVAEIEANESKLIGRKSFNDQWLDDPISQCPDPFDPAQPFR